jgi:hypothetical protein
MRTVNQYLKNAFFRPILLALILMAFSCTQDTMTGDLDEAETLKATEARATAARPIKAQLDFLFDYVNTPPESIIACGLGPEGPRLFQTLVSGNMSHLGKLEPGLSGDGIPLSGSYFMPVSCSASFTPGLVLTTEYTSVYIAANGDELHAIEYVTITFADANTGTFEGMTEVNGTDSTGRFAGAEGGWELKNGTFNAEPPGAGASWEIRGSITY